MTRIHLRFFEGLIPLESLDQQRKEQLALILGSEGGFSLSDWEKMTHDDVTWFLKELKAHQDRVKAKMKKPRASKR